MFVIKPQVGWCMIDWTSHSLFVWMCELLNVSWMAEGGITQDFYVEFGNNNVHLDNCDQTYDDDDAV